MAYLESCLKDGIDPLVDPFNLPETYPDVHGKRKKEFRGEVSPRAKKKKKVAIFQDEYEVPLSERQKTIILKDTYEVVQPARASGKFPADSFDFVFVPSRILPLTPPSQPNVSEPLSLPTHLIVSVLFLEQPLIPPPSSPLQLQTTPTSPPLIVSAPQPTNPNVTPPRKSHTRSVSDGHVSEGTSEETFNFEPEITSPKSFVIILPSHPSVFGLDFDESIINLTIKYPKIQTPSSPDLRKILMEFDSEFKKCLEKAMTISHSSEKLVASDSVREAYRSWMNSEVSKMKDLGYTLAESKFLYGFVPLMELLTLSSCTRS